MIQTDQLCKEFESKKQGKFFAVRNVTFSVNKGEIYGLLGANGAGKTTTLRMLGTILKPTSGSAVVAGYDVVEKPTEVRSSIGFLSGDTNLYARLTAGEVMKYYGELYGMSSSAAKDRVKEVAGMFSMESFIDKKIAKLSTGQRQRVSIGRAIMHDPDLMIFDEPTSGLDPKGARHILDFIRGCSNKGKTVLFSTHYLREAEKLCDRIGIIHNGSMRAVGTLQEILTSTSTDDLEMAFFQLADEPAVVSS